MEKISASISMTATAAEVAGNFALFKELAQRGPVAVTSQGEENVVLLSAAEYARLKSLDDRVALYSHELPDDLLTAMEIAEPPESAKVFDHELARR